MRWVYKDQIQSTLTIPYYAIGTTEAVTVRLTTEEGEQLDRAYLCLLTPDYQGFVRARLTGTERWYRVGSIYDTECFIGTMAEFTFKDIEIQINLPLDTESGPIRLPFVVLHGDHKYSPNRNFCGEDDTAYDPLWGDDEFDNPLWSGSQGGCPLFADGSRCTIKQHARAIPAESISAYQLVTTYLDSGDVMMEVAEPTDKQTASVVGMVVGTAIEMLEIAGQATTQSEDGRYIYEHGGQKVTNGELDNVWYNSVRVLDTYTGEWLNLGNCGESQQRDHMIAIVGDDLYILGGRDGTDGEADYIDTVYKFDLTSLSCSAVETQLPSNRAGGEVVVYGDTINLLLGFNELGGNYTVDQFDTTGETWNTIEPPPDAPPDQPPFIGYPSGWFTFDPGWDEDTTTARFQVCVDNTHLWVWTQTGLTENDQPWVYDVENGSWEQVDAPASFPGEDFNLNSTAIHYNGKIYVGNPFNSDPGASPHYQGPDHLQIYDIATNTWSEGTGLPPDLDPAFGDEDSYFTFCGAYVYSGKIYYAGLTDLYEEGDYTQDPLIIVYDPNTDAFDQTPHNIVLGSKKEGWNSGGIDEKGYLWYVCEDWLLRKINLRTWTATAPYPGYMDSSYTPGDSWVIGDDMFTKVNVLPPI